MSSLVNVEYGSQLPLSSVLSALQEVLDEFSRAVVHCDSWPSRVCLGMAYMAVERAVKRVNEVIPALDFGLQPVDVRGVASDDARNVRFEFELFSLKTGDVVARIYVFIAVALEYVPGIMYRISAVPSIAEIALVRTRTTLSEFMP